jgi:hypothetical protein
VAREDAETFDSDPFGDSDARVFVTDPDNPGEGRAFVWSLTRWFERITGQTGAVEFSPIAESEDELRERLSEQGLEITELDDSFAELVREEFEEQTPLYPEAPELSDQPRFR